MTELIAVEGPSGSGKDYYCLHDTGRTNIPQPVLPRVRTKGHGAWSSSGLEYLAIAAATMEPEVPFISNRFLISRWIYRAMQFEGNVLSLNWYSEMKRSYLRLRQTALLETKDRLGFYLDVPNVHILVLLPTIEVLMDQRGRSGKEYPFNAFIETFLYREVTQELIRHPIPHLSVSAYGVLYDNGS